MNAEPLDPLANAQECAVYFLRLDGWQVVIREVDMVCLVRYGNAHTRTAFAEVSPNGRVTYPRPRPEALAAIARAAR